MRRARILSRMPSQSLRLGIGLLAAAATLLGCASSRSAGYAAGPGASRQENAALPGKPGCFWLRDFDGSWTVLNDRELIVYTPLQSTPYLIELFAPVPNLEFAERLGFVDIEHSGMICDGAMDDLAVPHWQSGPIPIVAVRKLTLPEERRLLALDHVKPPLGSGHAKDKPAGTH
jgi:hypothetical protein